MKHNKGKRIGLALTIALGIPFLFQNANVYAETNPERSIQSSPVNKEESTPEVSKENDAIQGDTTEVAPTETPSTTDGTESSSQTQDYLTGNVPSSVTGEKTDGSGTAVDYTDNGEKKFYTIKTKEGNTYYMIVDNEKTSDNVYFLTEINDAQLKLAENSTSAATTPEVTAAPTTTTNKSSNNTIWLALGVLVIGGGAAYYFKIVKPKSEKKNADDIQDDDLLEQDDDDENEESE